MPHVEVAASNYNYIAGEYYHPEHETCRDFEAATESYFRSWTPQLAMPPGGMVLDVGCGSGLAERYLGTRFTGSFINMDLCDAMLKQAEGSKIQADALRLPFKNGAFTKIAAFLFDAFNRPPFESEVIRTLLPGGIFVGTVPSWDWASTLRYIRDVNLSQTRFRLTGTNIEVLVPSYVSPAIELETRFKDAGFAEVITAPIYPEASKPGPYARHIQDVAHLLGRNVKELEILTAIVAKK